MRAKQSSEQNADRIRDAVEKNPRKMTLQLARDLGVPEVEVIRAFPPDRATELDIARWEELFRSVDVLAACECWFPTVRRQLKSMGSLAVSARPASFSTFKQARSTSISAGNN